MSEKPTKSTTCRLPAADLRKSIGIASRAMAKTLKRNAPVLGFARLTVRDGSAQLQCTDLDNYVTVEFEAEGEADVLMRPKVLAGMARAGDGMVSLTTLGDAVEVRSGDFEILLNSLVPVDDWPVCTWGQPCVPTFDMAEGELREALVVVRPSISTEETRYYLNGAYLHKSPVPGFEGPALVATNGHSLCLCKVGIPGAPPDMPGAIIPRDVVDLMICTLKAGGNRPAEISFDPQWSKMRLKVGETIIHAKMVDGRFPAYEKVVPQHKQSPAISAVIGREQIERAVALLGAFRSREYAVHVDPEAGTFRIDSAGEGKMTFPLYGMAEGPAFGVNIHYLRDMTRSSGDMLVRAKDPGSPILCRFESPSRMGVIMPMRI